MSSSQNLISFMTSFSIHMTLKIHVIVDHYGDYFKQTGTNFKFTNDEHHEAIHHSLKVFESKKVFT